MNNKERDTSMQPLSTEYEALFTKFTEFFNKEMDEVEDPTLERELQNLQAVRPKEEPQPQETST